MDDVTAQTVKPVSRFSLLKAALFVLTHLCVALYLPGGISKNSLSVFHSQYCQCQTTINMLDIIRMIMETNEALNTNFTGTDLFSQTSRFTSNLLNALIV